MKKFIIFGLILTSTVAYTATEDDAFFNSLQTCSSYTESGQVNTDGLNINFRNQILGWDNDKCVYKEYVTYSGMNTCTTCRFNQKQINELVKVMRAHATVLQYSGEKIDTSSLNKVQSNPVVKVWNKYLQDSSVCTIEMKE